MEEESSMSFKSRVEKIFGSKSGWSVTGDVIHNKQWKHQHHSDHDSDEEDQNDAVLIPNQDDVMFGQKNQRDQDNDDHDDDDWNIRASIGLDPTLDYEAEEDEYDKVAEGREHAGERLYMKDVTDHGPYLNSHNVLPEYVHHSSKDSRANHRAAKARLEEDKAESLKSGNLLSSKVNKLKPVLKIRDKSSSSTSSKAQRRVRFEPYCLNKPKEGNPDSISTSIPAVQTTASDYQVWITNSSKVPDYMLNPMKYTCYTFDSTSEVDNMEGLDADRTWNRSEVPLRHPKFTPRKKESGGMSMDSSSIYPKMDSSSKDDVKPLRFAYVIADEEIQTSDDMDVEDADAMKIENQKPNRRYRSRPKTDDPIS